MRLDLSTLKIIYNGKMMLKSKSTTNIRTQTDGSIDNMQLFAQA